MGLAEGLRLMREGAYFAAHEELEIDWRSAADADRDFLQGLVHVAVAWYQAGRGNRNGCERQLSKAVRRLSPYPATYNGVDVAGTLHQVREAQRLVAVGTLELPRLSV